MCLIRKKASKQNSLGRAVIAGDSELVVKGHLPIRDAEYSFNRNFSQIDNFWTSMTPSTDELVFSLRAEVEALQQRLKEQVIVFEQTVQLRELVIEELQASFSWKVTAPMRWIVDYLKRLAK